MDPLVANCLSPNYDDNNSNLVANIQNDFPNSPSIVYDNKSPTKACKKLDYDNMNIVQEEQLSKTPPGFNGFQGMDRPTALMGRGGESHMGGGMYGGSQGGTPFSSMSTNVSSMNMSMSGMDSRTGMINRNF